MIKFFKNGVLEAETLDLPQDCGDINVIVSIEEVLDDACYYLEFSCPRNIKYISGPLTQQENGDFVVVLPRGISDYMGEVYVQLVIMSKANANLISRSLIARDPLFVIKESILATKTLESNEKQDFFEYAHGVVVEMQDKIDNAHQIVADYEQVTNQMAADYEQITNQIPGKIDEAIQDTFNDMQLLVQTEVKKLERRMVLFEDSIDESIFDMEDALDTKVNSSNIKTTYSTSNSDIYSAGYINTNFKKIQRGQKEISYVGATTNKKVGNFIVPASGYLVIYFGTSYVSSKPSKVSIVNPANGAIKIAAASDVVADESSGMIAVTLCDYVTANTAIELYVKCSEVGPGNNIGHINYILVED